VSKRIAITPWHDVGIVENEIVDEIDQISPDLD
jgi:hypothetical protein